GTSTRAWSTAACSPGTPTSRPCVAYDRDQHKAPASALISAAASAMPAPLTAAGAAAPLPLGVLVGYDSSEGLTRKGEADGALSAMRRPGTRAGRILPGVRHPDES